jgi:tetratricopeptide (TPR) repeat protein
MPLRGNRTAAEGFATWMSRAFAVVGVAAIAACAPSKPVPSEADQAAALYHAAQEACARGDHSGATQRDQTIEACTTVIESSNPPVADLVEALKMRAGLYYADGKYDEAIHDYGEVIRVDPRDAVALRSLGDANRHKGKGDPADPEERRCA